MREFNESTFSLLSDPAMAAIAAAEQLPMMSERRVVRIKDFAKLRETDEDVIIRYLDRPADSTVMIFIADDLDKRKKLTKTLLANCAVVEFARREGRGSESLGAHSSEGTKDYGGRAGVDRHRQAGRHEPANAFVGVGEIRGGGDRDSAKSRRRWSTN